MYKPYLASRFFSPVFVFVGLLIPFFLPLHATAQNQLLRISSATRSDGKGYVIRLHGQFPPDSFRVYQSSAGLIQVAVYHPSADTTGIIRPVGRNELSRVTLHRIAGGVGISLGLAPGDFFLSTGYVDANKKDVLVPLTRMPAKDVQAVLKGLQPIDWSLLAPKPVAETAPEPAKTTVSEPLKESVSRPVDDAYSKLKTRQLLDVIVIDAGHGGKDPGALGKFKKEKEITLAVSLKVGELIKKEMPYVKIVYTRDRDNFVELEDRGHIANKQEGDLFLSIHCNSVESKRPYGASFYFLGMHRSDEAYKVMLRENSVVRLEGIGKTTELSEEQLLLYELTNRGYMESSQAISILLDQQFTKKAKRKSFGIRQAGFMVLYYSSMPAVLIELGFISNQEEERYMASESGQNELAQSIVRSILQYRDQLEKGKNHAN